MLDCIAQPSNSCHTGTRSISALKISFVVFSNPTKSSQKWYRKWGIVFKSDIVTVHVCNIRIFLLTIIRLKTVYTVMIFIMQFQQNFMSRSYGRNSVINCQYIKILIWPWHENSWWANIVTFYLVDKQDSEKNCFMSLRPTIVRQNTWYS